MDDRAPRVGRALVLRAALAAVLIVATVGGAVVAFGVDQFGSVIRSLERNPLPPVGTEDPEPGDPQTILVLGTDGRRGTEAAAGARADTMLLVRMDADADATTVMSVPRDLRAEIPGHGTDKVNAAFAEGGAALTTRTLKRLLSRPGEPFAINHVVQVSFEGFRALVDELGCTWVDVDRRYFNDVGGPGGYATIDVEPGYQRLCGRDSLDYVRYRHTDNDLVRGARQQAYLRQMATQLGESGGLSLARTKALARVLGGYVRTDRRLATRDGLIGTARLAAGVAGKPVVQVPFGVGRLQDEPPYLVAPADAVRASVDRLLQVPAAPASAPRPRARRARPAAPAMTDVRAAGEDMATGQGTTLGFRFAFPTEIPAGGRFAEPEPRRYALRAGGRVHRAYRTVVDVGGTSGVGRYLGVQGTTWTAPPILDAPHETRTIRGRRLEVFREGRDVALVAWRTRGAVYWVSNTLTRDVPASAMVATARSLTRLR